MSIRIDKNACVGCGACVSVCPANFAMSGDEKAEAIGGEKSGCVKTAVQNCPVDAISEE